MNPLHDFNRALSYIEAHLDEVVDVDEAARLAVCTPYHFSRMFSTLAGVSLSEYVRRRRMTQAALELLADRSRVIDVAVKYGYSSGDAFRRAFRAVHGVPPSQIREASLKAYPRMSFQLTLRGAVEMQYRIVTKGAFRVVGLHRRIRLVYEGVNPEIQAMFESLEPATIAMLKALSDTDPRGIIQATMNPSGDVAEGTELEHYVGAATTLDPPGDLAVMEVSAGLWAVFTCRGPFPKLMQETWARIFTEWFPSSTYQHDRRASLVWCEHPNLADPGFHCEIWVPVTTL